MNREDLSHGGARLVEGGVIRENILTLGLVVHFFELFFHTTFLPSSRQYQNFHTSPTTSTNITDGGKKSNRPDVLILQKMLFYLETYDTTIMQIHMVPKPAWILHSA